MIKNYFKIAWRNLLKHKSFSLINIFGLAIGIAACLIIFIYIRHELTFDQYNKNADRIARITATVHALNQILQWHRTGTACNNPAKNIS
jgi:putative ABC transport system permease protein